MNRRFLFLIILLIIFVYICFIKLPYVLYPGSLGGSFGIRPLSHECFGLSINADTTIRYFPKGDIYFYFLWKGYEYFVTDDWPRNYCIGQDIWFGE
ncbi:hypothetical protein A2Y99_02655 [Candidatus Gottesmanbacteria bacterium RBG_13_37_7]|uniref:Uncharacterized protein n=1 Tax=Candidatus Gottesmanbacteria bacterium RBG_13_37_7 TaxID=1798369 RepID=A0A1F5YKB3_9BACT|nr:MAG: hypothetical protein A2Y99_02655 [Candidatus Gottesmanbacteria bacterium RBG_13_37_7]